MQGVYGAAVAQAFLKIFLLLVTVFITPLISCVLAWFLLRFFIAKSAAYNLVDVPDGQIKRHEKPIPHVGGLALYLACMVVMSTSLLFSFLEFPEIVKKFPYLCALYAGTTLFFLVGFIDDKVSLKPYQKALGQCIAALCVVWFGVGIPSGILFYGDGALLSIVWMVTIANAFNLIDIMDGLATTVSFFIALFFLCVAVWVNNGVIALCVLTFLGSLIAFFMYNKPPASVYLGDAGALYIGGFLSIVSLVIAPDLLFAHYNGLIFVLMFAIPLLETVGLIGIRTYKGTPFYLPSRDHFSLLLLDKGWGKKSIILYIAAMSLFLLITSFVFFIDVVSFLYYCCAALIFLAVWGFFLTGRHA